MAATEVPAINLRILSPSPEVENGVNFTDVPASTTVRELRDRIQDAVPSRPAPERMRLIYRGRVVASDADTLGDVFGADTIRETRDQSLHLVLREVLPPNNTPTSSSTPRSSTAPPNPFRPAQAAMPASPPLQTNPFRALPQPRPNSQPQPHHHHHAHVQHHHPMPAPPNPFQIPLPPALQQQLAQAVAMGGNGQTNAGPTAASGAASNTASNTASNIQAEEANRQSPTPANNRQGPRSMGLPPLPGFGPQNLPPNSRTVRQAEGFGPNGERWSVTYSSSTIPIMAQPQQQNPAPRLFQQPSLFGLPPRPTDVPSQPSSTGPREAILASQRGLLADARWEIRDVVTLMRTPLVQGTRDESSSTTTRVPYWRLERIWAYIRRIEGSLSLINQGMIGLGADDPEALELRQSANEIRTGLDGLYRNLTAQGFPSNIPIFSHHRNPAALQSLPAGAPEELFLLSSPQGPVGILFNQQGTYMTAPMAQTLPFQTFTDQFTRNRQIISGLGQHIARASPLQGQVANYHAVPTPTQPNANTGVEQQPQVQPQQEAQVQNQVRDQNANVNQAVNPPDNNDRLNNIAGHLWLVLKLACFVYFFSGGGGWYKSIVLGVIAGGVYLAQLGIFEEQFNLVRRHFEAILPVGALAERAARPRNADHQAHAATPGRSPTPEEAARRLLQQEQTRRFGMLREFLHTVERSFAIFIASLWPGIGERMVHAHEERVRVERAAEEERRVQAEEARMRREEEKKKKKKDEEGEGETQGTDEQASSSKGKERAAVAQDEPASASEPVVRQGDDQPSQVS